MKKLIASSIAALLVAGAAVFAIAPVASSAEVSPTEWHTRASCVTTSTGYCTFNHPLGTIPVVQVTPDNLTAIVHTANVTATNFRVRVMQTTTVAWANKAVVLNISATAPLVASTPAPSASISSQPTSPSPTVVVPSSPSPSVVVPTSPSATPTPVEPVSDYPTAANTGVPAGTTLTTVTGDVIVSTPNTVIDGKKISGNVDIRAAGTIIKNSEIGGFIVNDNTSSFYAFTVRDSTVGPATGCSSWQNGGIGTKNYTVEGVKLRGFTDGLRIAGSNVLIKDSFVTLCGNDVNAHSDGIQAYGAAGATNIVIDHNVIDQRPVIDEAQTAPIFIPNDSASQGNQGLTATVTNNVLAGGGYSLRVFGSLPFSAPSISGNKIVDKTFGYGPVDVECSKISAWSGNATVTYDWINGKVLTQVKSLDNC